MSSMVNKTLIDFKREPKDWGNALYIQLGQLVDSINQDIIPAINDLQEKMTKLENKITLLNNRKI